MKKFLLCSLFLCLTVPAWGQQNKLSWTHVTPYEKGFEIERAPTVEGPFVVIGTTLMDIKTFIDVTTPLDIVSCYRVRSWNERLLEGKVVKQYSGYSNIKCGSPLHPDPGIPTDLLLSQTAAILSTMTEDLTAAQDLVTRARESLAAPSEE